MGQINVRYKAYEEYNNGGIKRESQMSDEIEKILTRFKKNKTFTLVNKILIFRIKM